MRILAPMDQEYPKTQFFLKNGKIIQNTKTQKRLEICQNQRYALRPEVSNPSGSVVSGQTKNTPKRDFFEKRKKSSKTQKLKNVQRYAKISDTPFNQRCLINPEAWFPPCFVRQNQQKKNIFGDFRPLSNKNVQMLDHFFPLLFPKDSKSLKILDIRLCEVGAKRPLNGTSKMNRQTDGRTNKHTDRRTFRLIESIGPEGRCFEKKGKKTTTKLT